MVMRAKKTYRKVVFQIEKSGAMGSAEVISRKVVNEDEEFVFYVLILKKRAHFWSKHNLPTTFV